MAILFGFWLLVPFPFWMLGNGFAGELVFWPSFAPDIALFSLLFVVAFYGPLLLMLALLAGAIARRRRARLNGNSNAQN
ncbi:MAG TPA: hypothetical protein VF655_06530 [Allosphingosinicella sp.]